MRNLIYLFSTIIFFSAGIYIWKAQHSGLLASSEEKIDQKKNKNQLNVEELSQKSGVIVEVGGEKLQKEDIDWEYNLLIGGVFERETMTPIPDLGGRYHDELQPLRKSILTNIVERKVLYAFIKRDKNFQASDPARFTDCLKTWQEALADGTSILKNRENKTRLKARLCEKSILDQYLKEVLFSKLSLSEEELLEFYKNHLNDFKIPERVSISQIVLADEPTAKKVHGIANISNFQELAKEYSIAPESDDGGKLGPFSKGRMPNIFDAAFTMKKGDISPILKSPYGYHLILVLEKFPGNQASFEAARPQIEARLMRQKEAKEYQMLVEKALAAVHVSTPTSLW